MRPDPHQRRPSADPDSIIYLGDVRKRRRASRRAPNRHYVAALVLAAIAGWAMWILIATKLAPARLLTYLAFFAPLAIAVFATAAVVSYAVDARRAGAASLRAAVRRGLIAAALVILNFVLLAAHKWSLPVGVATVVAAVVADIALRPRARATTSPRPAARVSARDE